MSAVNRGITHSYREKSREPGKILWESGSTKDPQITPQQAAGN
jgi:K+-transporting ATPase c subunit